MKKKLIRMISAALCLMMLFSLAACSGGSSSSSNSSSGSSSSSSANSSDTSSQAEAESTPTKETDEGYVEELDGYTATTHWVKDEDTGTKIFGVFYKPDDFDESSTYPTIILSHGIGVTHTSFDDYISYFMELGIVCYAYDFPGGSATSKSRGDLSEMSVLTEQSDLLKVIDDVLTQSFVDTSKLVLLGESQGGAVTAITADSVSDKIVGEILLYPALCIADNARAEYSSLDEVPDTITVRGLSLGKVYYEDVWDMDMIAEATTYTGSVLILHGTADESVPYEYSEQAAEQFADATLVTIPDAGHGFTADEIAEYFPEIQQFLENLGVI
ncbi:MAG: alpha/beta hydrolase [Clostridiales bacterium]|nr:alpha/beta hydrolase [Clostridiales bacterium]